MLLKFVVGGCATNGWLIGAGKVVNWYKAEGDRVEYGQDLCDLLVEEVRVPRGLEDLNWRRWHLNEEPAELAELAARMLNGERPPLPELHLDTLVPMQRDDIGYVMRMTACDSGIIRRIFAREGDRRPVGDVLALLTTDPDDSPEMTEETVQQASVFRVVASMELWPVAPGVEERPRPSSSRRQARRPRREPAGQASRSKASATSRPRRGRQGRDTLAG